ncbi:MAG TPA: hypothetical protein VIZ22_00975 [Candidatus Limnocylindrales bacterium]
MTSTPPRLAPFRASLLTLLVVAAAACGQSTATPTPTARSSTSAATVSPTAAPTPPPTPAPTMAAVDVCADAAAGAGPSSAPPEQPSPDADDPNAARYEEIEGQVSALRGLTLTTPVERDVFNREELGTFIQGSFGRDNPESLVASTETLLKALALMPQGDSLRDLYVEMLTSQVAGLYDDTTKSMYVISDTGEIGPLEEITYAHEYTHALQDQAFGLSKLHGDATDQGDRQLARTTLIEGDATLLMFLWAQQNLPPEQLLEVAGSSDPASQAVLDRLPALLKETLMFPYTTGLGLTQGQFVAAGGYAGIDALFADPPDSTEQVLHPEKLNPREAPIEVTFDADLAAKLGAGWCVALQDTLGEFQLGIVLRDAGGADTSTSNAAAAGWGGDRVALVGGPDGELGVMLDTRWDTAPDAGEFARALGQMAANLEAAGRSVKVLTPAPDRVVLLVSNGDDTLGRLANVLGFPG